MDAFDAQTLVIVHNDVSWTQAISLGSDYPFSFGFLFPMENPQVFI